MYDLILSRYLYVYIGTMLALALVLTPTVVRPDKEMQEKFYRTLVSNRTQNATGDGSITEMLGRMHYQKYCYRMGPIRSGPS
jgi:hypothetical protein